MAAMQQMPGGDSDQEGFSTTARQLNSLIGVVNNLESFCKVFEAGSVSSDAVIPKTDPHSADAASTTIVIACNRIMEILQDEGRWKGSRDRAEADIELEREEKRLQLRKQAMELDLEECRIGLNKRLMKKQALKAEKAIEGE